MCMPMKETTRPGTVPGSCETRAGGYVVLQVAGLAGELREEDDKGVAVEAAEDSLPCPGRHRLRPRRCAYQARAAAATSVRIDYVRGATAVSVRAVVPTRSGPPPPPPPSRRPRARRHRRLHLHRRAYHARAAATASICVPPFIARWWACGTMPLAPGCLPSPRPAAPLPTALVLLADPMDRRHSGATALDRRQRQEIAGSRSIRAPWSFFFDKNWVYFARRAKWSLS